MRVDILNKERKVSFSVHNVAYTKLKNEVLVLGVQHDVLDSTDFANLKSYCDSIAVDGENGLEFKIWNLNNYEIAVMN